MMRALKVALAIVQDTILVTALLWMVLYVFSGQAPSRVLFETVLIYAFSIAAPAHIILCRVFPLQRGSAALQWTAFVLLLTAIAAGGTVLGTMLVLGLHLDVGMDFRGLLSTSLKLAVFLALLVGVVQATFQRLRDRLQLTEVQLQAQAIEHERALKLVSEAKLAALEARVHPHFLFNALNTVSALIPEAPERAERLVEQLSAVLRFSLDAHNGRLCRSSRR